MLPDDLSTYTGVFIGSIGTILAGLLTYFGILKKTDVDETSVALSAWKELVQPMQLELKNLKDDYTELKLEHLAMKIEYEELKRENTMLRARVRSLEKKNGVVSNDDDEEEK